MLRLDGSERGGAATGKQRTDLTSVVAGAAEQLDGLAQLPAQLVVVRVQVADGLFQLLDGGLNAICAPAPFCSA